MFTGIVEEIGEIAELVRNGDRAELTVACATVLGDARIGASIAVDGCCVTVSGLRPDGFRADLMAETVRVTSLGGRGPGDRVNLERPVAAGGRFGGHLVQGHVDGVGEIVERRERPGTLTITVAAPAALSRYLVPRGSVAVQGVSLTVIDVDEDGGPTFRVGVIPHTAAATTLGSLGIGDHVNLEVDVVAKYVERFLRREDEGG